MSVDRCWRAAQSVGVEEVLTWPAEPRGWAGYYPRTSTNTRGKDLWLGETKLGLHDDSADISISTIPDATDTQGTAVPNDLHAATISNTASLTAMRYDPNNHRRGSTQAPGEFPYFQRLPAEIRNMIWEYSLPESRVYEVLDAPSSKQKTPAQKGLMFANVHPEPPPALAAVCRESRSFVLHQYKPLTLGSTTKYVDLSRDILLLEPYLLVKRLHRTLHFMSQIPLIRDNINQLALGTSYGIYPGIFHPVLSWKVSKTNMSKLLSSLSKFPRLNTLVFIVHQEFQFEFDCRFPGTMTPIPNNSLLPPSLQSYASATTGAGTGVVATGYPSPASGGSPVATLSPLPNRPPTASSSSAMAHPLSPMSSSNRSIASSPTPSSYLSSAVPSSPESGQQPHQQYRPQLIHQAYRFKFDIEANINHTPRRPHHNEFQYYPLDIDQEKDDWDLGEIGEEGEWCDPRPTNDDWRRFRKRFMWAMDKSLEMEAASLAQASLSETEENIKGATPAKQCYQPGRVGEKRKGEPLEKEWEKSKKKRLELPKLKLKGASLLWRYTNNRGAYA